MGAAATRIALDGDTRRDDVERFRPVAQHGVGIVGAGAVEDIEKALPVLEHIVARRHTRAREHRGHHAVAGAVTHMQRLWHGAQDWPWGGPTNKREWRG